MIYNHDSEGDQFTIFNFENLKKYIDKLKEDRYDIKDPLTRKKYVLNRDFVFKLNKKSKFVILKIDKLSEEYNPPINFISLIESHFSLDEKKFFIDNLDINCKDSLGNTFLHFAVLKNDLEIIFYLIAKGINIDAQDAMGNSAIQLAFNDNNHEIVKILLNNGSNIILFDKYYLELAIEKGNLEIVKLLLDRVFHSEEENNIFIRRAIEKANVEIVKLLLSRGCDINEQDHEMLAMKSESSDMSGEILQLDSTKRKRKRKMKRHKFRKRLVCK